MIEFAICLIEFAIFSTTNSFFFSSFQNFLFRITLQLRINYYSVVSSLASYRFWLENDGNRLKGDILPRAKGIYRVRDDHLKSKLNFSTPNTFLIELATFLIEFAIFSLTNSFFFSSLQNFLFRIRCRLFCRIVIGFLSPLA